MTKDEIEEMAGRVQALTQVLTAVIQALPANCAAQAATALAQEIEASRRDDEWQRTPGTLAGTRNELAQIYLGLLLSVGERAQQSPAH